MRWGFLRTDDLDERETPFVNQPPGPPMRARKVSGRVRCERPQEPLATLDTSGKYRRGRHYSTTRVDRVSPLPPGANRSPMNSGFEGEISRKERVINDLAQILVEIESQEGIS